MKFIDVYGRERNLKNAKKYLINWDKPSRSKFQTRVKDFLQPFWIHDIVFEEFRVVGSRLTLDFYNANKKIAVEVQGEQHTKYVKFFHKIDLSTAINLKEMRTNFYSVKATI